MTKAMVTRRAALAGGAAAGATAALASARTASAAEPDDRPNIVFILTDDHAAHAVSAYGSELLQTPHIDRIAREGIRFDNAFCTNSICTPSRASYLTGAYSHINGVTTLASRFDARQVSYPRLLQQSGYQTAIFGKWHLGHGGNSDPQGFDEWEVLPGQGAYYNPEFIRPDGRVLRPGYVSDVITDLSLDWLENRRDPGRPFALMVHQKAPHRPFDPGPAHAEDFEDVEIPEPRTLRDDYGDRSAAAAAARMRVGRDLTARDLKEPVPPGLTPDEELSWKYRRYMEDYLRCVASVDDNVGRVLDAIEHAGIAHNTIVVYTSDQGFFLGDHGWFDKRFMYEQSLRMPFVVRWPKRIQPGSTSDEMILNIDVAQTFLELAGLEVPERMQGRSLVPLLLGRAPQWRSSVYYRYWMHDDSAHHIWAHYGVRTRRYKLIYFYNRGLGQPGTGPNEQPPEWEMFDLDRDPDELHSVHDDPAYADVRRSLERELSRLQELYGDQPVAA